MEEQKKVEEKSLVIYNGIPGLVRYIYNASNIAMVTFFTEGKSIEVYIPYLRLITPNERQQLAYIKGTKIMTLNQDRLIEYIKNIMERSKNNGSSCRKRN